MSDIDRELRAFLAWEAEKRRTGLTDEALHAKVDWLHRAQQQILNDRLEDRQRTARHAKRIEKLEHQVALMSRAEPMRDVPDWKPDPRDITGSHDLALVKAQTAELRDEAKWWKRNVLGGIAIALLIAAVAGCAGIAVKHLTFAPEPAQHAP